MNRTVTLVMLGCLACLAGCEKAPPPPPPIGSPAGKVEAAGERTAFSATAANSGAAPASGERGPNERFYTMQAKLDVGGSFYLYADLKDALKKFIDNLREAIPQSNLPEPAPGIILAVLSEVERSGLYGVHDLGISTLPEGELNINKLFLRLPDGRKGLFALMGGPAHEIKSLAYAPADTMLFGSLEFDVAGLLNYIREAVKNVGGESALQNFNKQLFRIGTQTGTNPEMMINSLAGNFTVVGTLDPSSKLTIPGPPHMQSPQDMQSPLQTPSAAPVQIDSPHIVFIIDTKDQVIYDTLKMLLTPRGAAGTETVAGELKQFALNVPPNPAWSVAPVIACDKGHCYLATHADYLQKLLAAQKAGGGLAQSDEFKRYAQGLPSQGNSMAFISDKLVMAYQQCMQAMMAGQGGPNSAMQEFFRKQFGTTKGSYSICVNQPDGILSVSRSSSGPQAVLAAFSAAPVTILAAIAVPNFLEAKSRASVSRVKNDQRSMATAIEAYYVDNNVYPATNELYRLTTPIAYITTLIQDPFAPSPEPLHYFGLPEGWMVWSAGPDQTYDLTTENILQVYNPAQSVPSPSLVMLTYDPTNGTTSNGDVWRVKQ